MIFFCRERNELIVWFKLFSGSFLHKRKMMLFYSEKIVSEFFSVQESFVQLDPWNRKKNNFRVSLLEYEKFVFREKVKRVKEHTHSETKKSENSWLDHFWERSKVFFFLSIWRAMKKFFLTQFFFCEKFTGDFLSQKNFRWKT